MCDQEERTQPRDSNRCRREKGEPPNRNHTPILNLALREEDEPAPCTSLCESEPNSQGSGVVMVPYPREGEETAGGVSMWQRLTILPPSTSSNNSLNNSAEHSSGGWMRQGNMSKKNRVVTHGKLPMTSTGWTNPP